MRALVVEKNKIRANLETVKERAGTAQVIAVLKANAYGLGLCEMAGLCREAGIRRFAVTEPEDALRLRDWGFGEEEILILRSTASEEEIRTILQAGATATVGSYDAALALNGLAESQGMMCDVHIKVDTGMGRYGFMPTEIDRILSVYRYLTNLNVTGTYTHYANAFRSVKKTQEQLDAQWQEGKDKALAFLKEAVEYDEEDSICLDNLGQFYYRVLGDKAEAKAWFDKAIAEKENQIDTLWFLSRYDLEQGDRAAAVARLEKALEGRFSPMNYCTKAMAEEELARLKK